jgi:SAM-dependent methyltransferase
VSGPSETVHPGATSFTREEFDLAYPPGIEAHYWTRARNLVVEHQVRELGLAAPRLLEIGCGRGLVLDHLRRKGFPCRGLELAPVEPLPSVRDIALAGADALDPPPELRGWPQAILLLDVLEHLPDPAGFLRAILDTYRSAAFAIVTVPARPEIWSNYDEFYGHRRRFDRASLGRLIAGAGGEAVEIRYFFRALYLPARILKWLRRPRPVAIAAPRPAARPIHRALSRLWYFEYLLLPRGLAGTSLVARIRIPGRITCGS